MKFRIKPILNKYPGKFAVSITFLAAMLMNSGCDLVDSSDSDSNSSTTFRVKFMNESASEYAITNLQLAPMGPVVDENSEPLSEWSENILSEGEKIEPGQFTFFNLDIPNNHWSRYRIGIDTGSGNELMLHEQPNQDSNSWATITHWGSHERTVGVTVLYDNASETYFISGYSDWAGID